MEMVVMLEDPNTASSDGPFGMDGDQLVPALPLKFQFPLKGVVFHVAVTCALVRAAVKRKRIDTVTKKSRTRERSETPAITTEVAVCVFIVNRLDAILVIHRCTVPKPARGYAEFVTADPPTQSYSESFRERVGATSYADVTDKGPLRRRF